MQETWVQSPVWEDPWSRKMATHSSILAWRIPWTEDPGGLQAMGSRRVRHDWAQGTCTHKWGAFSKAGRLLVEWQYFPNWYRSNRVSIQIPAGCCAEIDKLFLQFTWKFKGLLRISKTISKENRIGGYTLLALKTYYKATVIKQCRIRTDIQINGKNWESKDKVSRLYLIDFWQGFQGNAMGKKFSFQQMVLGWLDIHIQKNEVSPFSHTIWQINSKWIKDMNMTAKTLTEKRSKLLEPWNMQWHQK